MASAPRYLSDAASHATDFVASLRSDPEKIFEYRFSGHCSESTLYASVYACLSLSVLGKLSDLTESERSSWASYFDSFQDPESGLFFDEVTRNAAYDDSDWWGARHVALHLTSAYRALGCKPKHSFRFLGNYYDTEEIARWLSELDWDGPIGLSNDIDNKIMNIACLLQYQRDTRNDEDAACAVTFIRGFLEKTVNPHNGMWGSWNLTDPQHRSRMVQFAYHLYPIFFYDKHELDFADRIVMETLKTQNAYGGFGVSANSSACEDIDSIDILCRFGPSVPEKQTEIDDALRSAFKWVLCNQIDDGGFVFRLLEDLTFGHPQLSSLSDQGAVFPTWFRLLSLAYLARYFGYDDIFTITRSPGYEF